PRTTEVIIGAGNGKSSERQSEGRSISSPSRSRLVWESLSYKKTDFPAALQAPDPTRSSFAAKSQRQELEEKSVRRGLRRTKSATLLGPRVHPLIASNHG